MCAPEALQEVVSIDVPRRCPSLGCTEHNHGPARPEGLARVPGFLLVFADLCDASFHRSSHSLVHGRDIASLDEVGCPSVTDEERFELLATYASENGRVVDLCPVSRNSFCKVQRRTL